jgi:hypothetical protein
MRKLLIGLLMAATAASPALAGKGGHGRGHGNQGGAHEGARPHGNPHQGGNPHRGGGKPHADRADLGRHGGHAVAFARPAIHANKGGHGSRTEHQWLRPMPVRVARFDDKQARKNWKREEKEDRKFARERERRDRFRRAERMVRVERYAPPRIARHAPTRVVRYVEPRPAHYMTRSDAPVYYQEPVQIWHSPYWDDGYDDYVPVQRYALVRAYRPAGSPVPASYSYAPTGYWRSSYNPIDPAYRGDYGAAFGGDDGVLGALLPILLQSMLGEGLGSGGLGGLAGLYSPDVLPLQQASYAPYADGYGETGLAPLLLPSLLGNGSLF